MGLKKKKMGFFFPLSLRPALFIVESEDSRAMKMGGVPRPCRSGSVDIVVSAHTQRARAREARTERKDKGEIVLLRVLVFLSSLSALSLSLSLSLSFF